MRKMAAKPGGHSFTLDYGETHLNIASDIDCRSAALDELVRQYTLLVAYINRNPMFKASYEPVSVEDGAPEVVRLMAEVASACGVGPMASVAGAFAELIGKSIVSEGAADVIVDNGGDVFVKASGMKLVSIYAGPSILSEKFGFMLRPEETPCGICTSSASVGPSISLGKSDSTTVVADSPALADAAASAIGNLVFLESDIEPALEAVKKIGGVRGVVVIKEGTIGAYGRLPELVRLGPESP